MSTAFAPTITQEHVRQFNERGYFLLESVIPADELEELRAEAQRQMAWMDQQMDAQGVDHMGITHKGSRYFISNRHTESPVLRRFLFHRRMAEICRATIGDDAQLFCEQFVVKCAEKGMHFGWHQDSGYIGHDHRPYLTCWVTLDEVSEANGTVYMLPYERAGTRHWVRHTMEEGTNDFVGYRGDDPGEPVIAPAGSIAVFSSTCFHRSSSNTTKQPRRTYVCQYSPEPIMAADGTRPWNFATPLLTGGAYVGDRQV